MSIWKTAWKWLPEKAEEPGLVDVSYQIWSCPATGKITCAMMTIKMNSSSFLLIWVWVKTQMTKWFSRRLDLDGLQPCSHEEADTRILLHIKDAMNAGYKDAIIRTVDTNVVVLAVAYFQDLKNIGNLWIAFGTGQDFRYIPVHEVARSIGPDMANSLPFFHALSGCDTTSQFANHGKNSA